MILNIYFCKTIARFQILVLAILATVFLLLDLIERFNDVGTGSFSAFNAIQVTILNAPYLIFWSAVSNSSTFFRVAIKDSKTSFMEAAFNLNFFVSR